MFSILIHCWNSDPRLCMKSLGMSGRRLRTVVLSENGYHALRQTLNSWEDPRTLSSHGANISCNCAHCNSPFGATCSSRLETELDRHAPRVGFDCFFMGVVC